MSGNSFSDLEDLSRLHGWHVYVVAEDGGKFCKIGTALNPKYRLSGLRHGNPRPLTIVGLWHISSRRDALLVETNALASAGSYRVSGRDWIECNAVEALALVRDALASSAAAATEVI